VSSELLRGLLFGGYVGGSCVITIFHCQQERLIAVPDLMYKISPAVDTAGLH